MAAAADGDLLVVGSRRLHGMKALGSVSERVAHRAPCSTLIVRERADVHHVHEEVAALTGPYPAMAMMLATGLMLFAGLGKHRLELRPPKQRRREAVERPPSTAENDAPRLGWRTFAAVRRVV